MHLTICGCYDAVQAYMKTKLGQKYYGISRNSEVQSEYRYINHLQFIILCTLHMKRLGLNLCFTYTVCNNIICILFIKGLLSENVDS